MNLMKSQDYFSPLAVKNRCHIIGCGSVGSTVAELLIRLGLTKLTLYDFDIVSPHNLANQMFVDKDIKQPKVDALKRLLCEINPEVERDITLKPQGWTPNERLSGYVFLCVDNIDLRREIVEKNKMNQSIKAVFDFRTRLEEMQCYAAEWNDLRQVNNLLRSMDFSHEEAVENTPRTACGMEIGVAPTVRVGCAYGVANFVNYIKGKPLKKIITTNIFSFETEAY